jgi:hypothetical protein
LMRGRVKGEVAAPDLGEAHQPEEPCGKISFATLEPFRHPHGNGTNKPKLRPPDKFDILHGKRLRGRKGTVRRIRRQPHITDLSELHATCGAISLHPEAEARATISWGRSVRARGEGGLFAPT